MTSDRPPDLPGVSHRYLEVRGVRLHLAEAGEGEPVLLLHGWPQNWWMWRHLIGPLAERFRVLCPDLRGLGWSATPPDGYDKDSMADDFLALLDALEIERARLGGHDWGGWIGFLLCLRAPERFERYLALNTGHPFSRASPPRLLSAWRLSYQVVLASPGLGYELVRRGAESGLLSRWVRARPGAWGELERELYVGRLADPERARATVQIYRSFLVHDLPAAVAGRYRRRIETPILWLHGARDPALPPSMIGGYEPYAPNLELEIVPGAGHFIAEEAPDLVRERALAFL